MVWLFVPEKQHVVFSESVLNDPNIFASGVTVLLEPPCKISKSYYRCSDKFNLDDILGMYDDESNIGVCLISGDKIIVNIVKIINNELYVEQLNKKNIMRIKKHKKGGQSAQRFGRIADSDKEKCVKKFSETIVENYMYDNHTKCKIDKLILAGPGEMKNFVSKNNHFDQHMNKILFKITNTREFDDDTVNMVKQLVKIMLNDMISSDTKGIDNKITNMIEINSDILSFGEHECKNDIELNNIKSIYVNKNNISEDDRNMLEIFREKHNISLFFTESNLIKMYGNWIGIKRFVN
jgi:peptide chain release factor subunit 1